MAKVTLAANAAIFKADSITVKQIETLEKHKPEALELRTGKENETVLFSIGISGDKGSLTDNGALFSKTAITPDGKAAITVDIPNFASPEAAKEFIADKFGVALDRLSQLEATIGGQVEDVEAKRAAVIESIEVAE